MALVKKPVTGMKDIMPDEMKIREHVKDIIKSTYGRFGFDMIETPCMEHLSNLNSKQGGDNEKLIFKTLKRGEKLKLEEAKSSDDLSDEGLRYDLTVPLARYYSNNMEDLPAPFKALQMGNVFRADRPQRGRYRQFMQCDIDILGDNSNMAEIELILATSTCLSNMGFKNFTIRINDRKILKAMANYAGINEMMHDNAFIELDKMDKIGICGVRESMISKGFDNSQVSKFLEPFKEMEEYEKAQLSNGVKITDLNYDANLIPSIDDIKKILEDFIEADVIKNLDEIINVVHEAKTSEFNLKFDPTLVRGMSYYTGTIFEISMDELGVAVGGGGRYDKMIGKFIGSDVPACGFSIGFERIVLILMEKGISFEENLKSKKAYLLDKKLSETKKLEIMKTVMNERQSGMQVLVSIMKKNKKFQKEQLSINGYTDIIEVFE